MVAREIDKTHVVIRAEFKYRNEVVRRFPKAFNVPPRYATHMMVVADLNGGWDDAVGDVIVAAWDLQRRSDYSSGSTGR